MKEQQWDSFQTSKPEFNLLPEGEHNLRVIRFELLNSFLQYSGAPKEELPDYQNPCPQVAITVVAADEGKSGGLTFRLNRIGFVKMGELPEKEQKKHEDINGWACYKDDDGDLVRREDPEKTIACENIANQFAGALGVPVESNFLDALEEARENQTIFRATVTNEPFEGKPQLRLNRFRSATTVAAETDFED